jgi:hypothetical protein
MSSYYRGDAPRKPKHCWTQRQVGWLPPEQPRDDGAKELARRSGGSFTAKPDEPLEPNPTRPGHLGAGEIHEKVIVGRRRSVVVIPANLDVGETGALEEEHEFGREVHPHREGVFLKGDTTTVV